MSQSKFMQLAKDTKACYKVGQMVLVKLKIIAEGQRRCTNEDLFKIMKDVLR